MLKKSGFIKFIILIAVIGGFIYKYVLPYYTLHQATREVGDLYHSLTSDGLNWKTYNTSSHGNPIYLLELGKGDKTSMVFGAFHGDEPGTFDLAVRLGRYLAKQPALLQVKLILIPVLNPDGLLAGTRVDGNGVDLNRNFPTRDWSPAYTKERYFPGREPASEKETLLAMQLIDTYKPDKIISIHDDLHIINYNGPAADLARVMAKYNHYDIADDIGYPTPGSFGTYAGEELNIPTITIELPPYNPEEAWKINREALINGINY